MTVSFMPHALLKIGVPKEKGDQPLTVQLEVSYIAGAHSTLQRQKESQKDSFPLGLGLGDALLRLELKMGVEWSEVSSQ